MIEPFAPYRRLRDMLGCVRAYDGNALGHLSGAYFADLATWYLLTWSGESLRRNGKTIPELMAKGVNFTLADRQALLHELGVTVAGLIPRYRALAERGQVELSCTPAAHPLAPLLIDFKAAREAWPECTLPAAPEYPGGQSRVARHLAMAQESHHAPFRPAAGRAVAGRRRAVDAVPEPDRRRRVSNGRRAAIACSSIPPAFTPRPPYPGRHRKARPATSRCFSATSSSRT